MQLSAKALLWPFVSTAVIDAADTNDNTTDNNMNDEPLSLEGIEDEDSEEEGVDNGGDDAGDDEDDDKDDNTSDDLTEEGEVLIEDTASVQATLDKVHLKLLYSSMNTDILIDKICKLSFAIIHSTTILPAWHKACTANSCPIHLIPCDVKTCWNSIYDMLTVAFDYCTVIDDTMANKSLKLCHYELDDQDWEVIVDLLQVLKVCFFLPHQCTIQLMVSSDV